MEGFWQDNWVWLLFGGMIAMHLFRMGGHGSHGGGGCCGPTSHDKSDEVNPVQETAKKEETNA